MLLKIVIVWQETGLNEWVPNCYISWLGILDDNDAPHTTTECMIYPLLSKGDGVNWGDMSHLDTGMAGILSGYILGIQPITAGFGEYNFCPKYYKLEYVYGTVPLADGRCIEAAWKINNGQIELELNNPEGCIANIIINNCSNIKINNCKQDSSIRICQGGQYIITGSINDYV